MNELTLIIAGFWLFYNSEFAIIIILSHIDEWETE